jgi:CDP-diacylglycerol--glycerol-3-phosphate 3-phosphatidyltransferase
MNLPNILTIARLILSVIFAAFLSLSWEHAALVACIVFILASVTDWLDGYLARKLKMTTKFGALVDPLADKILVCAAFIGFVYFHLASVFVVICIIMREFLITGLRTLAASKGVVLSAEKAGKSKTITQMITAVLGLLILVSNAYKILPEKYIIITIYTFQVFLWLTLILTIYSGIYYLVKNKHVLAASVEETE